MSESEHEKSLQETEANGAELLLGLTAKNPSGKRKRESKKKESKSEYNGEDSEYAGAKDEDNSDSETESDEDCSGSNTKKPKNQNGKIEYKYFGKRLPPRLAITSIKVNNKDNYVLANLVRSSLATKSIYDSANDEAATKYFKTIVKKAEERSKQYNVPYQHLVFNCIRHGMKKGVDQHTSGFNLLIKRNFLGTAHYLLNQVTPEQKDYILNLLDEMITYDIKGFNIYENTALALKTRLNSTTNINTETDKEPPSGPESSLISAITQQTTSNESKENKESSSNKENAVLPFYQTTYHKNGKEQQIHISTDFVNSLKQILLGKEEEQDQTREARIKKASEKIDDFFKDRSEAAGIFAYRLGSRISKNPLDPDKKLTFFAFLIKHNFLEINEKIIEKLEYKEHADQLMRSIQKLISKNGFENFKEQYTTLDKKIKERNLKSKPTLQKNRQEISSSSSMEPSHLTAIDTETPIGRNEEKTGGEKRKAQKQLYNNLVEDEAEINTSIFSLSALTIPGIDTEPLENKEAISSFKKRKRASLPYYKRTYLNENNLETRITFPREFVDNLKSKILSEQGPIPDSLITEFSTELDEIFKHPEPDSLAVILGKYRNLEDRITLFTFLIEHDCLKLNEKFIDQLTNQEQANLLMRPVKTVVEKQLHGFQKYVKGYNSLLKTINAKRLPSYKATQTASSVSSSNSVINQTLAVISTNTDVEIIDLTLHEKKNEQSSSIESSIIESREAPLNHHHQQKESKEIKTITEEETPISSSDILTIQAPSISSSSSYSNEKIDISLLLQLSRESEQAAIILLRKKLFSNKHRFMFNEWVFQLATHPTPYGVNFFTYLVETNNLTMAEMIVERLTEEEINSLFDFLIDRFKFLDKSKLTAYTDSMNTLKDFAKTLGVNIKTNKKPDNKEPSTETNKEKTKSSVATSDIISSFGIFAETNNKQPAESIHEFMVETEKAAKPTERKKQNRKYAKGISVTHVFNANGTKTRIHTNLSDVYNALERENKPSYFGLTSEASAASILSHKLKLIADYKDSHSWAFEIAKQRPHYRPEMSFLAYLCKLNRLEMAKSVLKLLNPKEATFVLDEIEDMISSNTEDFKDYGPRLVELKNYYKGLMHPTETPENATSSSSSNASNLETPTTPAQSTQSIILNTSTFFNLRQNSPTTITPSTIRSPSRGSNDSN